VDEAPRLVQGYVEHYNNIRLKSAISYITPRDTLAGLQQVILGSWQRLGSNGEFRRQQVA
jgi:putative transposase